MKLVERSYHCYSLFDESRFSNICTDSGIYRTQFIVETHQKDQEQPTSHFCSELSETPIFPVSIVKQALSEVKEQIVLK